MPQAGRALYSKRRIHQGIGAGIGLGAAVLALSSMVFAQGKPAAGKKSPEPPASAKAAEQAPPPPPPEPQCDQIADKADRLVCQGRLLAGKGDFKGAYPLYLDAWNEKKSYDIAGNLALAEMKLGKLRESAEHFLYCEQNYPSVKDPEMVKKLEVVRKLSEEVRAQVGMVRVKVVRDDGKSAEGAEVLMDGRFLGRVGAGGVVEHPLLGTGKPMFAEPGNRSISARVNCGTDKDASDTVGVVVSKGREANAALTLQCREVFPLWPALVAGGVGLAGIGTGVATLLMSNSKEDEAAETRAALLTRDGNGACLLPENGADCDKMNNADSASATFHTLSLVGFIVGGAGLVAGGVLGYMHTKSTAAPTSAGVQIKALPVVYPGGGGAWLSGRF